MNLCFIGNSHLLQFNISNEHSIINKIGASIKGLVNPHSTLQLKEQINTFLETHTEHSLIFFLGQVDIEFGYYYKCIVDNFKYDIDTYYNELIASYEIYLQNLSCKFYILSINPTTIIDTSHIFNVCFRCNNGRSGFYSDANEMYVLNENVKELLNDSYSVRFNNNKLFNIKLQNMCQKNGFKFIDLWDLIVDNGEIKEKYRPTKVDHHLKHTDDTELLDYILKNI